jgi:hypothetical protein
MHTLEMKKKGFIKNKVVEATITRGVKMATLIPFTHVYQLTLESDVTWGVRSQHLPNIIYAVKFSFTKYLVAHVNGHCKGTCVNTKLR